MQSPETTSTQVKEMQIIPEILRFKSHLGVINLLLLVVRTEINYMTGIYKAFKQNLSSDRVAEWSKVPT